jgi:hypothetical protein
LCCGRVGARGERLAGEPLERSKWWRPRGGGAYLASELVSTSLFCSSFTLDFSWRQGDMILTLLSTIDMPCVAAFNSKYHAGTHHVRCLDFLS